MRSMLFWFLNIVAALVILVLLGLHLAEMHLSALWQYFTGAGPNPLDWEQVVARGNSTTMLASYILLLGAALFHGFYGVHNILVEALDGAKAQRAVGVLCWVAGLALFLVGTFVTVAFNGA